MSETSIPAETLRAAYDDLLAKEQSLRAENNRLRALPTRDQIKAAICGDIVCDAGDKCELCSDAAGTVMALIKAVQSGRKYEWVEQLTAAPVPPQAAS